MGMRLVPEVPQDSHPSTSKEQNMKRILFPAVSFVALALTALAHPTNAFAAEAQPCNHKVCFQNLFLADCEAQAGGQASNCSASKLGLSCGSYWCY